MFLLTWFSNRFPQNRLLYNKLVVLPDPKTLQTHHKGMIQQLNNHSIHYTVPNVWQTPPLWFQSPHTALRGFKLLQEFRMNHKGHLQHSLLAQSPLVCEKNVRIPFQRRELIQSENVHSGKTIPFPMREFSKCSLWIWWLCDPKMINSHVELLQSRPNVWHCSCYLHIR